MPAPAIRAGPLLALAGLAACLVADMSQARSLPPPAPTTWERDVGVRVSDAPDVPIISIGLDVLVPHIYTVIGTPSTQFAAPSTGDPPWIRYGRRANGDQIVSIDASFPTPVELAPFPLQFRIVAKDPVFLPAPITITRAYVLIADGTRTTDVRWEVIAQSSPDGVFEPIW